MKQRTLNDTHGTGKGLTLMGRSRSGRRFYQNGTPPGESAVCPASAQEDNKAGRAGAGMADVTNAFEEDLHLAFKTVMKWEI